MKKAIRLVEALPSLFLILTIMVALPAGADTLVLPGPDKSFEQFQSDDAACRQWAAQRTGQQPQDAARDRTIQGSIIGTFLGAGLGAAIGAATGDPGVGAAIGAGSGLLLGTVSGAEAGRQSGYEVQNRFDIAYQQCMYAKGNQIPGVPARQVPATMKPSPSSPSGSRPANDRYDPPYPYPTRN
jgi:hypothetical protein